MVNNYASEDRCRRDILDEAKSNIEPLGTITGVKPLDVCLENGWIVKPYEISFTSHAGVERKVNCRLDIGEDDITYNDMFYPQYRELFLAQEKFYKVTPDRRKAREQLIEDLRSPLDKYPEMTGRIAFFLFFLINIAVFSSITSVPFSIDAIVIVFIPSFLISLFEVLAISRCLENKRDKMVSEFNENIPEVSFEVLDAAADIASCLDIDNATGFKWQEARLYGVEAMPLDQVPHANSLTFTATQGNESKCYKIRFDGTIEVK